MTVQTFDPNQFELVLTDAAKKHLSTYSAKNEKKAVRLWLKESGCTGYMYELDLVDSKLDDDLSLKYDGFELYVARDAMPVLNGTTVDYVREGLNSQLKFINPNVTAMCGCGESFSVN